MIPFLTRARIISVASGKGGAGKTNVSVNLAVAFAQGGDRTLLIDCDMGLANAAILLGMPSAWTIGDLLAGPVSASCPAIAARAPAPPSRPRSAPA